MGQTHGLKMTFVSGWRSAREPPWSLKLKRNSKSGRFSLCLPPSPETWTVWSTPWNRSFAPQTTHTLRKHKYNVKHIHGVNQLLGEQHPEQQATPHSVGVRRRSWSAKSPEGGDFNSFERIFISKTPKPKVGTQSAQPSPLCLALALKSSPWDPAGTPINPSHSTLVGLGEIFVLKS